MPVRPVPDISRAWSVEALPPAPGMVLPRPLKRKGLLGKTSTMEGSWQVLAAQTLKIASINGLGELDKLENELEDEIRYENRSPAKTIIGRLRREGQHKLHSKVILFIIVLLNIIDCLLVMAELTLDFHHVTQRHEETIKMLDEFETRVVTQYKLPSDREPAEEYHHILLQKILDAYVIFNTSSLQQSTSALVSDCAHYLNQTAASYNQSLSDYVTTSNLLDSDWSQSSACFQPHWGSSDSSTNHSTRYVLSHRGITDNKLMTVAHKLHYISISILSVLVLVVLLKFLCNGVRFFRSRMQVFDGIIIIISFILDIVFIEGVAIMALQEVVIILTFLLPWRILRVLNSLIVAVLDKQRLNLKIIYTQKKKISRNLSESNAKVEVMERHIEVLQNLCSSRGLSPSMKDVRNSTGKDSNSSGHKNSSHKGSSQKNGSSGGLAGMMALGKLAFQAADAFTPITGSTFRKSGNSTPNGSAPGLTTGDTTPTPSVTTGDNSTETATISDNNNASSKSPNGHVVSETKVDMENDGSQPGLDTTTSSTDGDLESVTIHLNGSGPPRETSESFTEEEPDKPSPGSRKKSSISMPDLTDQTNESDVVSYRL